MIDIGIALLLSTDIVTFQTNATHWLLSTTNHISNVKGKDNLICHNIKERNKRIIDNLLFSVLIVDQEQCRLKKDNHNCQLVKLSELEMIRQGIHQPTPISLLEILHQVNAFLCNRERLIDSDCVNNLAETKCWTDAGNSHVNSTNILLCKKRV